MIECKLIKPIIKDKSIQLNLKNKIYFNNSKKLIKKLQLITLIIISQQITLIQIYNQLKIRNLI